MPRDKAAERDLNEGEHDESSRREFFSGGGGFRSRAAEPDVDGDERREEERRERQMEREPDRRDRRHAGLEARRDHDPADDALRAKEQAHAGEDDRGPKRNAAPADEPEEAGDVDEADEAPELAMRPLPPINRLERVEAHAAVQQIVLRAFLVALELRLPCVGVERRDGAGHEIPLGDREAGLRQPRRAADEHHGEREQDQEQEPAPHADETFGVRLRDGLIRQRWNRDHAAP